MSSHWINTDKGRVDLHGPADACEMVRALVVSRRHLVAGLLDLRDMIDEEVEALIVEEDTNDQT